MADLIDRQAAKAAVKNRLRTSDPFESGFNAAIDAIPAAREVEVVRCECCKHKEYCEMQVTFWMRDYVLEQNVHQYNKLEFCSYGERRADDEAD